MCFFSFIYVDLCIRGKLSIPDDILSTLEEVVFSSIWKSSTSFKVVVFP